MENLDWLQGVCLRPALAREELSKPFTITRDGKSLTVSTNGHAMVEIPGDYGFPPVAERYRDAVEKVLVPTSADSVTIDYGLFQSFILGAMDGACRSCDACDSEGEEVVYPHDERLGRPRWRTCTSCLGSSAEPVRIYVDDIPFNARLFELPILNLPSSETLRWASLGLEKAAILDGGSWRLVEMPMRSISDEGRRSTIPVFHIDPSKRSEAA